MNTNSSRGVPRRANWAIVARAPVHWDLAFPVVGCAGGGFLNDRAAHNARMCPRTIPKGLRPPAQGWRATPTLGARSVMETTPTALRPRSDAVANGWAATALRLMMFG